jgi:NADP-dependent 3-hydroxy acid dehydrogenase YdfG
MYALHSVTAVVTGAGSGIGRAVALALAREGARVCLLGRTLEKLHEVIACAGDTRARLTAHRVDFGDVDQIRTFASDLDKELKRVDLLVHSAGEIFIGSVEKAAVEKFDRLYRVNVRAPYLLTQVLLPSLKSCRGQIVFINSSAGLTARKELAQYAATKHALKALADSLRQELNPDGVRVISIYPGKTATPMQEALKRMAGEAYHPELFLQPEDVAAAVVSAVTIARTAEVTDLSIRPMQS